jgi:hypothetical protein
MPSGTSTQPAFGQFFERGHQPGLQEGHRLQFLGHFPRAGNRVFKLLAATGAAGGEWTRQNSTIK